MTGAPARRERRPRRDGRYGDSRLARRARCEGGGRRRRAAIGPCAYRSAPAIGPLKLECAAAARRRPSPRTATQCAAAAAVTRRPHPYKADRPPLPSRGLELRGLPLPSSSARQDRCPAEVGHVGVVEVLPGNGTPREAFRQGMRLW